MPKTTVNQAVRNLRTRLGDTQQQFAHRLGMAISTVVRYELSRPPRGKTLALLERVSLQHGFTEEALVFREALDSEMGIRDLEGLRKSVQPTLALAPETDCEMGLVHDLIWAIRCSKDANSLSQIERQLEAYRMPRLKYSVALAEAVLRLLLATEMMDRGVSDEEISSRFNLPPEALSVWCRISGEVLRVWHEDDGGTAKLRQLFFDLATDVPADELVRRYSLSIFTIGDLRNVLWKLRIPMPAKHP